MSQIAAEPNVRGAQFAPSQPVGRLLQFARHLWGGKDIKQNRAGMGFDSVVGVLSGLIRMWDGRLWVLKNSRSAEKNN
jgi:hypothetical protein